MIITILLYLIQIRLETPKSTEAIVAIVAAVIAFISALYARQAVQTAVRTYNRELITQLYSLYQSDIMLKNIKICWNCYRTLWISASKSEDFGIDQANKGSLVPLEYAVDFFNNLDTESDEFKAIHYMINYWTYLGLLIKNRSLNPDDVIEFTTPHILGFLVSMSKAYSKRYPNPGDRKSKLEYAYEILIERQ